MYLTRPDFQSLYSIRQSDCSNPTLNYKLKTMKNMSDIVIDPKQARMIFTDSEIFTMWKSITDWHHRKHHCFHEHITKFLNVSRQIPAMIQLNRPQTQSLIWSIRQMINVHEMLQKEYTDQICMMHTTGIDDIEQRGYLKQHRLYHKNRKLSLTKIQSVLKSQINCGRGESMTLLTQSQIQQLVHFVRYTINMAQKWENELTSIIKDFNRFADIDDITLASRHCFDVMNNYRSKRAYFAKRKAKLVAIQTELKKLRRGE